MEPPGRGDRDGQGRNPDVETAARSCDRHNFGGHETGQEQRAVNVQRAGLGLAPARMAPGWNLPKEHKLDGVLIGAKGGWLRSSLPPHHGTHAGGDAEHEGNERCDVMSPLGRNSLPRRGSGGATLEGLRRLLHAAIVGIVHIQTIRTARGDDIRPSA